ncbi:MAG TPA: hypothetical protein VLW55_16035 [Burkholderiaceae bacterium]|nr:hypothetical protein [Burkholderiaceae bacterium]
MNGFDFSILQQQAPHRDRTTPYARKLREQEEQAFYEHFGKSNAPGAWKRALTSITGIAVTAVAAIGVIVVAVRETLGT